MQIFEKGAAADVAAKKPDTAADKFAMLAYAQFLRGDKKAAAARCGRREGGRPESSGQLSERHGDRALRAILTDDGDLGGVAR